MNKDWDPVAYEQGFSFVHRYGADVMDLIEAPPGARVVDVGCGNGALTAALAERGYRVLGIDASPDMVAAARSLHPDIPFIVADACTFALEEPADVIFSNAVFHWVDAERQPELLARVSANLVPGGQLVCELGGHGCAQTVHRALARAFARHGRTYRHPHYFPTIGQYAPLLEEAGLAVEYAVLFDRPTPQQGADGLERWIRMFLQRPFEDIPADEARVLIDEAVEECRDALCADGTWIVDYVRLRLRARKLS